MSLKKKYFLKFKKCMDKLNIKFLTMQETVLIPEIIESKKTNHLLVCSTKRIQGKSFAHIDNKTCAFLLQKYYCFPKIIDMLPLTKFIHVHFKFFEQVIQNNQIFFNLKITYLFATPLIINNLKSLKQNISMYLIKTNNKYPFNLLTDTSKLISQSKVKSITTQQFLHLILPKYKYGTSTPLMTVPKQPKTKYAFNTENFKPFVDMSYKYDTENPKWHRCIFKNQSLYETFTPGEVSYYRDPTYPQPEYCDTLPTKFLVLNSLEFPTSLSLQSILFFIIYNYMLLNNIYLNTKQEFVQILQTHPLKTFVTNTLIKHGKLKDLPIYDSLLINHLPIQEQIIGNFSTLLEKLPQMITHVSTVLNIYFDPDKLFKKLQTFIEKNKTNENCITPPECLSKTELLKSKGYSETSEYLDTWYELVVLRFFWGLPENEEALQIISTFENLTDQDIDDFDRIQSINIYL